jgi:hypothetical protein
MATADRLAWRTSSYTDNGADCVEVAPGPRAVLVRDTKDRGLGPVLLLDHAGWAAFCAAALAGATGTVAGVRIERWSGLTRHDGGEVATGWHVRAGSRTLHFTDREWDAFRAGVRDGEFDFAAPATPA